MLGCVAFTLCFFYHPFQDAQKIAILNAQYFMPDTDRDRVSDKLRDLVRVILVPNPVDRPTIDQILQLLTKWNQVPKIILSKSAE